MPKLHTESSSDFASELLSKYLPVHGIKHIFARPYHPYGRGKILSELGVALCEAIAIFIRTPHEALDNVSLQQRVCSEKGGCFTRQKRPEMVDLRA